MKFRLGQKVVLRRNNGPMAGHPGSRYYHGYSISEVPLGSKATIYNIRHEDMICVTFENKRYGTMYVHPSEVDLAEEQRTVTEHEQRKINSQLEEMLSDDTTAAETSNTDTMSEKAFKPKFNVREEFAVWIRQEFPQLQEYAERNQEYTELTERKAEVMESARKAYGHAIKTTDFCFRQEFRNKFDQLEWHYNTDFPRYLYDMITYIEKISANLTDEVMHYGTMLAEK